MNRPTSPRWAYVVCCSLAGAAFCMFLFFLDRYPVFFPDEPWFSLSAARLLDGKSFVYALHSQAPFGDTVLSPHGPFFFRFQVWTLSLLGVSHFACRLPGYVGGHVAVLLLALFLLRQGFWKSAMLLSLLWVGDRSALQLLLGRPEGLSLAFVAGGFICLVLALQREAPWWLAGTSLCIGIAAGFNPGAAYFGFASLAVAAFLPKSLWTKALLALTVGIVLPVALVFLCWMPSPSGALTQFFWYYHRYGGNGLLMRIARILREGTRTGWAETWNVALILVSLGVLLPLCLHGVHNRIRGKRLDRGALVALTASVFSLAGIAIYLKSSGLQYYLLYLTPWPVIALASAWEIGLYKGSMRKVIMLLGVVVVLCWGPSLVWNVSRCREAVIWFSGTDKALISRRLMELLPPGASITGDPVFFVEARNAGFEFEPLSAYGDDLQMPVSSVDHLVVSKHYESMLRRGEQDHLVDRRLLSTEFFFRDVTFAEHTILVYGPAQGLSFTEEEL